ncbi:hypothetical protein ACFH04_06790 [Streptomyces noboritoensis]|uniref:Uncharacterized protein n=1 Tax=Streptomyces noboritoensis TaxID=67337 RepID=A0ABV6TG15_9ACTN
MSNPPQAASPADADARDQPLTLAVLRQLLRNDWRRLPGSTLVVLSSDAEGNTFSPFASYSHSRYAPTLSDLVGDVFPLPEQLAKDPELRELFPTIPDSAVRALVLFPLG